MDQSSADDIVVVKRHYTALLEGSRLNFPADGVKLDAPEQRGVYVI
jgi:hypothetical protein